MLLLPCSHPSPSHRFQFRQPPVLVVTWFDLIFPGCVIVKSQEPLIESCLQICNLIFLWATEMGSNLTMMNGWSKTDFPVKHIFTREKWLILESVLYCKAKMKVGSVKCVFPEDVCSLWWVYGDILSYVKQQLCSSQTLVQDLKKGLKTMKSLENTLSPYLL